MTLRWRQLGFPCLASAVLVLLTSGVLLRPAAAEKPPLDPVGAAAEARGSPPGVLVDVVAGSGPSAEPGCTKEGECTLIFYRPAECRRHSWRAERRFFQCETEERTEVRFTRDGVRATRPLPDGPPRNLYPKELLQQWRYCPFTEQTSWGPLVAEVVVPYQDPDVGHCWLLRLGEELAPLEQRGTGLGMLNGLHPYLQETIRRLLARSLAQGDHFKVISGNRPPTMRKVWVTRQVTEGGRRKQVKEARLQERAAGWHSFGLAVDVNLMHRHDMGSASAAFLDPASPERAAWFRFGELAEEYGLIWLGHYKASEIFHLEWHPGWPGLPRGQLFTRLRGQQQQGGLPEVWKGLQYDATRSSALKQLKDPPLRLLH